MVTIIILKWNYHISFNLSLYSTMFNYRLKCSNYIPGCTNLLDINTVLSNNHKYNNVSLLKDKIMPVLRLQEDERCRSKQIVNRLDSGSKSNSNLPRHLLVTNGKTPNSDNQSSSVHRFNSLKERRRTNINNSRRMTDNWGHSGRSVSPRLSIKCFSGANKMECTSNSLYVTDTSNNNVNVSDSDRDVMARSMRINSCSHDLVNNREFHAIQDTLVRHSQIAQSNAQCSPTKNVSLRPSSASSTISKADVSKSFILSENSDLPCSTVTNNDTSLSESKSGDDVFLDIVIETEQITFHSPNSFKKFDDKDFWTTRPNLSAAITSLLFYDIDFSIIEKYFTQIKARFPSAKKMGFHGCNFHCFNQINSLATLKRLEELNIEKKDNPITEFSLLRYYVAFRLAHLGLRKFNDLEISESEFLSGRRYFLPLAIIGPGQVLQLHLVGVISDTKRRELLHSSNDAMTSMTMNNFSSSQTPSVNLDLVGKSGLLSINSVSETINHSDDKLSNICVNSVLKSVDKECKLEETFHTQWLGALSRLVHSRLQSMGPNRHEYMRRQYQATVTKPKTTKSVSVPTTRK